MGTRQLSCHKMYPMGATRIGGWIASIQPAVMAAFKNSASQRLVYRDKAFPHSVALGALERAMHRRKADSLLGKSVPTPFGFGGVNRIFDTAIVSLHY